MAEWADSAPAMKQELKQGVEKLLAAIQLLLVPCHSSGSRWHGETGTSIMLVFVAVEAVCYLTSVNQSMYSTCCCPGGCSRAQSWAPGVQLAAAVFERNRDAPLLCLAVADNSCQHRGLWKQQQSLCTEKPTFCWGFSTWIKSLPEYLRNTQNVK